MPVITPSEDGFADVVYYVGWWDCPRSGVTLVDGVAMLFDSPFDEGLDDFVPEFYLWPATEEEVAEGLEVWRAFAAWRARFDAGQPLPPFEQTDAGRRLRDRRPPEPPTTARRAVPEWRLDPDGSFADRTPRHKVRWRFPG